MERKVTIRFVQNYVEQHCPHVKVRWHSEWGEFRIAYKGLIVAREEAMAAYTDDPTDAFQTAQRFEDSYKDVSGWDKTVETRRLEGLERRG